MKCGKSELSEEGAVEDGEHGNVESGNVACKNVGCELHVVNAAHGGILHLLLLLLLLLQHILEENREI